MDTIPIKIAEPQDNSYTELLRFYCQTSEQDDPTLPFMASMWSYSLANGCLTGKQAKNANLYINHRLKTLGLEGVVFDDTDI
jgi:hypothetical protein